MSNYMYVADASVELPAQANNSVDFILTDTLYDLTEKEKRALRQHFTRISINGFINFSPPENPFIPVDEATHNYFWTKPLSTKNYKRMVKPSRFVELCQFYQIEDAPRIWNGADLHWSMSTNILSDIVHHNTYHKWRKPLSLIERLIKLYTAPGNLVLDPFSGSGVVAEACIRLGRRYKCFDIDKGMIAETKERLSIL